MTSKAQLKRDEQSEAIERLRELLPPGSTVTTVLRHVSRSGMMREIDAYLLGADGEHYWLSGLIDHAGLFSRGKGDALRVSGCGMDMGFHVVSTLARVLYPDGFGCIGPAPEGSHWSKGCPSNDHVNRGPLRDDYTLGHHHAAGDYALRHRWL